MIDFMTNEIEAFNEMSFGFGNMKTYNYEAMFSGNAFSADFIGSISEFFDIKESFDEIPKLQRLSGQDWRDRVLNWQEIEACVSNSFPHIPLD